MADDYVIRTIGHIRSTLQSLAEAPRQGSEGAPATHADAARDLGTTAGAIKVAVHRLRRRFRKELLKRVADTLGPDQDVEAEIRHLLETLGAARGRA